MNQHHIHTLLMLLLGTGCATTVGSHAPPASHTSAQNTGIALREQGEHLGASYYFELALSGGAEETKVLPPLIDSLIRAGRMNAAERRLTRLCSLMPDNAVAAQLLSMVREIVHQEQGTSNYASSI